MAKKKKDKWRTEKPCAVCGNDIIYQRGKVIRCEFCKSRVVWMGDEEPQEVRGKWGE